LSDKGAQIDFSARERIVVLVQQLLERLTEARHAAVRSAAAGRGRP
jgi:hypothetical protein